MILVNLRHIGVHKRNKQGLATGLVYSLGGNVVVHLAWKPGVSYRGWARCYSLLHHPEEAAVGPVAAARRIARLALAATLYLPDSVQRRLVQCQAKTKQSG